jgi:hypothetical protein
MQVLTLKRVRSFDGLLLLSTACTYKCQSSSPPTSCMHTSILRMGRFHLCPAQVITQTTGGEVGRHKVQSMGDERVSMIGPSCF